MNYKKMLVLFGVMLVVAAVLAACGGTTTTEAPATEAPAAPPVEVPYLEAWQGSGHNNVTGEQFRHWDDATENQIGRASCRERV